MILNIILKAQWSTSPLTGTHISLLPESFFKEAEFFSYLPASTKLAYTVYKIRRVTVLTICAKGSARILDITGFSETVLSHFDKAI